MSWNQLLQPNLVLGRPILNLTPEIIQQYDLKGLVLDVDETLVPLKNPQASAELHQWVEQIKQIAPLWMVSNNLNPYRIGRIAADLNLPYLMGAGKPSRRKLRRAVTAMELPVDRVAMVGDRLFTDVLAGNRLGMFTILVEPMVHGGPAQTAPLRAFEAWLGEVLGASLTPATQNFTNIDRSSKTEI